MLLALLITVKETKASYSVYGARLLAAKARQKCVSMKGATHALGRGYPHGGGDVHPDASKAGLKGACCGRLHSVPSARGHHSDPAYNFLSYLINFNSS